GNREAAALGVRAARDRLRHVQRQDRPRLAVDLEREILELQVADLLAVIGQRAEVDPKRRIACLRMHGAALRDEREHGGGSERANGQSLHVYSAYALSLAAI